MTTRYKCGQCRMVFRSEILPVWEARAKSGRCPECGLLFRDAEKGRDALVYVRPEEAQRCALERVKCP